MPARTLAHWSDQDVVHPLKRDKDAGSGVHRRFPESEIDVVAILNQASSLKLPVGTLRDMATFIRKIQTTPKDLKKKLGFELRFDDESAVDDLVKLQQQGKLEHAESIPGSIHASSGFRLSYPSPLGHTDTGRIVSWFNYYSARHRPEREQRVMMYLAARPYGCDGYVADEWGENFEWDFERDGKFDFSSAVRLNLSAAFARLHVEPTYERDSMKRLLEN